MLNTQSMNLDLIRTFVIVGQSKDFSEAATKLNINYTNVSRHIKTLESLMGTKLIKRDSKNYIELTDDGKKLFDGYEKAYNLLFITEKTFIQDKNLDSGKISIGISNDIDLNFLNDKIISFKSKYPNAAFKTINLPSKSLYEKLSHYNIDFVIDEKIDLKKSSEVVSQNLYKESYCLCYLKEKYNINDINDIKELPLILPVSTKQERELFEDILNFNGITKKLSIETSNYNSSIQFVNQGLGIALVPTNMITGLNLGVLDIGLQKQISISYIGENLSPSSKEFLKEFVK